MSRYTSVVAAIVTSQVVGLAMALLLLAATGEVSPGAESFAWAGFSGAAGVIGLGFFYLALARGTMGIIAPLAALIGAGLPVLVAIVEGETVSPGRLGGIALALLAVVLISLPSGGRRDGGRRRVAFDVRELPLAICAGLGFAGFFIGIDRASTAGAMWWPLVFVRTVGVAIVLGLFAALVVRARGAIGPFASRLRPGSGPASGKWPEHGRHAAAVRGNGRWRHGRQHVLPARARGRRVLRGGGPVLALPGGHHGAGSVAVARAPASRPGRGRGARRDQRAAAPLIGNIVAKPR